MTILHPRDKANHDPVFAGWFPLNGNGELTSAAWLEEGGFLEGPIGLTVPTLPADRLQELLQQYNRLIAS